MGKIRKKALHNYNPSYFNCKMRFVDIFFFFFNKKRNCIAHSCRIQFVEIFFTNKAIFLLTLVDCPLIISTGSAAGLVGYVSGDIFRGFPICLLTIRTLLGIMMFFVNNFKTILLS